jgi:hypothetical protein
MTRQERIKIRAERIKARDERIKARQQQEKEQLELEQNAEVNEAETNDKSTVIISKELPSIVPDGKLTIEICIHCFRYQRRLTWMLSSILQQKGDVPNIIVNISHTDNDGTPTTEEVCNFFRSKGLNIKETKVTEKEVSNRAFARNIQSTETTADWILFADSDMVYSEDFFDDLQKKLKTILKDVQLVMGADRYSLNDQFCIDYFEKDKTVYPCIIENAGKIASEFPVKRKCGSGIAPGNFQLISGKVLKGKCKGKITDRPGDHWRKTKGDRALRVRAGGRIGIETKGQYHLNHDRGGPDIQR